MVTVEALAQHRLRAAEASGGTSDAVIKSFILELVRKHGLRGTYLDSYATLCCVLLMSVTYLVYIMGGQFLLGKLLRYFPIAGYQEGVSVWKFVLLPSIIGTISGLGANVRFYRTMLLEEMHQDRPARDANQYPRRRPEAPLNRRRLPLHPAKGGG